MTGSLFRKYVAYFVALVSAALIVSGLVGLYFSYEESKTARLNLQREKADSAASKIAAYVQEIEHHLNWVRLPEIWALTPEQRQNEYLKLLAQVPAIADLMLIDSRGREQLSISRVRMNVLGSNADRSASPGFTAARSGKTYFSPVYFRKQTEPYMTIGVGGSGNGDGGGVTLAEVNLKFIWDVITQIRVGTKGFAYLIDARGRLIAHPDISLVLQKTDLSTLAHVKAALAADSEAAAPLDALDRVMVAFDRSGVEVLVGYASIPRLGWHVFVEQPLAEALAPLYASLMRTGLLLLAGLVVAVVVSLVLARHMVTPIRAVQAGAARIAAGNLDQRISVRTGDELETLAREFNAMARQLRESYAGLERKVAERTRELSAALEQQTATSEVLKTISRTSFDLNRVLEELIASVVKLGHAQAGGLYLKQAGGYELRVAFTRDPSLQPLIYAQASAIAREPSSAAARALDTRQAVQTEHGSSNPAVHATLAVPILREGAPIGVIVAMKRGSGAFSDQEIALVVTFADQAGIAIENVRMFNEIRQKSVELELANRHKSEFLANVSHELRTPLNAIIGFSEVLGERMFGELNAKQAEYVADIHGSGKHLLALINDILNLSKIEAGRMELELSRFDLTEVLRNALSLVRERASRQNIALALELGPGLGEWVADERKVKQIMLNLLSNAVKFTPAGGRVSVRAEVRGEWAEITVSDTGVGIAEDHLELIFDEFRQVGTDYLRRSEGTGLGLALTKRYVELHGGSIRVISAPGKGSRFVFTLPRKALETA